MAAGCCHNAWLLTGHAQLPRANAIATSNAGAGRTNRRAVRNTNSAAAATSREAVKAAPYHHQKRSVSMSTNRSSSAYIGSPASGAPIPNVFT